MSYSTAKQAFERALTLAYEQRLEDYDTIWMLTSLHLRGVADLCNIVVYQYLQERTMYKWESGLARVMYNYYMARRGLQASGKFCQDMIDLCKQHPFTNTWLTGYLKIDIWDFLTFNYNVDKRKCIRSSCVTVCNCGDPLYVSAFHGKHRRQWTKNSHRRRTRRHG